MQLTLAAEYAVRTMIHLASLPADGPVPISDISRQWDIPEDFLRKITVQLARAGLVNSRRGKAGGIRMARDPKRITLLDVIEAVEGPILLNRCLVGPLYCSRSSWCEAHVVWGEAQEKMKEVLMSRSIAALALGSEERRNGLQVNKGKEAR
jgi:Rrf2 family iron-sulfur cluster assembly transcriptional regulator